MFPFSMARFTWCEAHGEAVARVVARQREALQSRVSAHACQVSPRTLLFSSFSSFSHFLLVRTSCLLVKRRLKTGRERVKEGEAPRSDSTHSGPASASQRCSSWHS